MIIFKCKFNLLQKVAIDGDVLGIVTMVRFHPSPLIDHPAVDYFVAWWPHGTMSESWIDEGRLS